MTLRRRLSHAARGVLAASAALGSILLFTNPAGAATPVNGGGSGFAALEISQWQADVASPAHGNLQVNFSSQSSGIGRQYFASNTWDFSASDIKYIPGVESTYLSQVQSGRCNGVAPSKCFVYVPVSAGGLGFMYNLSDASGNPITNLRLTPADVCGIFTGAITAWNDPNLTALNPSLANVSPSAISPVVRQDEAGESYVLSEYCIAEDPSGWATFSKFQQTASCTNGLDYTSTDGASFAAGAPIAVWPSVLLGCHNVNVASGADGVANVVHDPSEGPGSITYDAAGYALVRNLPNAAVENAAGDFTEPGATSVTVALEYASPVGDGTFTLDFNESSGADPRAYNPSTYSYILAQTAGYSPGKGSTIAQFLCYAIGAGQSDAAALLYAPLSAQVQKISETATLEIPGAPSAANCLQGAPAAPPPPPLHKVTPVTTPSTVASNGGTGSTPSVTTSTGTSSTKSTGGSTGSGSTKSNSGSAGAVTAAGSAASAASVGASGSVGTGSGGVAASNTANSGDEGSSSAIETAAAHSPGYDAVPTMLEGAALCAVGVLFAGMRKKSS